MKLNEAGRLLIKSYEGVRLVAYKAVPTEKYFTIGYGHYGADVKQGMIITLVQADKLFEQDIQKFIQLTKKEVERAGLNLNDNQFSALVSFCYNCGTGNLRTLISGRTTTQIAQAMPRYCKSGGKTLPGLVRRRAAEVQLFNVGATVDSAQVLKPANVKSVQKWLKANVNKSLKIDGIYGNKTKKALCMALQIAIGVEPDGKYGKLSKAATPMIGVGSENEIVFMWQCILVCNGYDPNGIDSTFGQGCLKATTKAQTDKGANPSGIVSANTFALFL